LTSKNSPPQSSGLPACKNVKRTAISDWKAKITSFGTAIFSVFDSASENFEKFTLFCFGQPTVSSTPSQRSP
jgi:cytochrome c oxidase assembly protein Cox11